MSIAALTAIAGAQPIVLKKVQSFQSLPSGIEIHCGPGTLRILALRNDVIRITESPTNQLLHHGSWAVLSRVRNASMKVTPEQDATAVGFNTAELRVRVNRDPLMITVANAAGKVLVSDARPVEFRSDDSAGDIGFRVWKKMPANEHYFGLGEKAWPLDRRGGAFVEWNTDAYRYQRGTDPLYDSIPFFLTDRAGVSYGIYLDNTWRSEFDFGKALRSDYSFGAEGGPLDYYVMYGPTPKKVVEDYAWLTGIGPLPPLWALGFQQSRYSYGTETELRGIAQRLRADKIPSDVLYMDIDYQVKNRPFTLDKTKFPNFPSFVQELKRMHFHLVLITDLHIAYLPGDHYAPYNSGIAGNHFLRYPNGKLYVGEVWPGPSVFPEFTERRTRQWWGSLYKTFYDEGVSGFWNDMNEPSIFDSPTKTIPLDVQDHIEEPGFRNRVTTQREVHNIMGMQNSRATYDGMLAIKPNQRPFVLTRATFAGGQRYAATWTGDNSSSWSHLKMSTSMLESLGLCGFFMAGDDIGGFAGSPSMNLLTKWLEVGSFNPIERDHTTKGSNPQEPWVGGVAQENVRRHFIDTRYRLMPYLYTTAEHASRTGIPIIRPLFLEFPDATASRNPLDLAAGNEFLFGRDLLVAPAPYPDEVQPYKVTFPPVPWYNFWTGELVAKGRNGAVAKTSAELDSTMVKRQIDTLPVYVRGGAIVPMQPLVQDTEQKPDGPLEVRVYPGPNCQGSLYQDDGTTLDYKHGSYLRVKYSCVAAPGSLTLHIGAQSGGYPSWWKSVQVAVYNWPSGEARVTLNGRSISGSTYDAQHGILKVDIPQSAAAQELVVTEGHRGEK